MTDRKAQLVLGSVNRIAGLLLLTIAALLAAGHADAPPQGAMYFGVFIATVGTCTVVGLWFLIRGIR